MDLAIVWLQCPPQFGCQRGIPGLAQMILPLHIYGPRQFHRSYTEAYWYHMDEGYWRRNNTFKFYLSLELRLIMTIIHNYGFENYV